MRNSDAATPLGDGRELRIGVDVGGTKIEAVALLPDGYERDRTRIATPQGDYGATVHAITDLIHAMERRIGQQGTVGVGIPGTVSPATGLVKNANSTWLIGRSFDKDLAAALTRPVRIANDANCFALSEATDGAGRDAKVVFGVIIGTGTGGGIVVNGEILAGPNAIAGEWGHNPLRPQSPTLARCERNAGASLLLRKIRLHRDLPVRAWTGTRLCGRQQSGTHGRRNCVARDRW